MHIAELETRHFSFIAAGNTDQAARDALMEGWRKHCTQTGAASDYIGRDNIAVTELNNGDCLRDGAPL